MVRQAPTIDVKKLQSVQAEALRDTNADVKKRAPAAAAEPERKKFDEASAVRQKLPIRLHRDKIKAFKKAAEARRKKFSDLINDAIDIGARELGISYDD